MARWKVLSPTHLFSSSNCKEGEHAKVVHCFICSELKTIKAHNDLTIKLLFQTIGFNITQTEGDQ